MVMCPLNTLLLHFMNGFILVEHGRSKNVYIHNSIRHFRLKYLTTHHELRYIKSEKNKNGNNSL